MLLTRPMLKNKKTAFSLLKDSPFLSAQVIIETYNACYKKLKLSQSICEENTLFLCDISKVFAANDLVIKTAIAFKRKYQLSFLDSMIIASADILYSEVLLIQ